MKNALVLRTENTVVFTKEGKILIPLDEDGKYSSFDNYDFGIQDVESKIWIQIIHSDDMEYKQNMMENIFEKHKGYDEAAVKEGFFIGNENALLDCGELVDSIYSYQVREMANCEIVCFIRDGRNNLVIEQSDGIQRYLNSGNRYLVLPPNCNKNSFRNCTELTLKEIIDLTFPKIGGKFSDKINVKFLSDMQKIDIEKVQRFIDELGKLRKKDIEFDDEVR